MQIDFRAIASTLLPQSQQLLQSWFPNGHAVGSEFKVGNLAGDPGDSLSINMDTGLWKDFASGDKGGDLISLYAQIKNISNSDAANELSQYGITSAEQGGNNKPNKNKRTSQTDITTPPDDAPIPDFDGTSFGKCSEYWAYKNRSGHLIYYVSRHDKPDGKDIVPWSWSSSRQKWVMKNQPKPRPLFGLEFLDQHPDKKVMLVEGEGCAVAGMYLMRGNYIVMTWPGGSSATNCVDWSSIYGRSVVLWPDADRKMKNGQLIPYEQQPGVKAMITIASHLVNECPEVKIIDVSKVEQDGWDCKDAVDAGWEYADFFAWAKPLIRLCGEDALEDVPPIDEASLPADIDAPEDEPSKVEPSKPVYFGIWEALGLATSPTGSPYANIDNAERVISNDPTIAGHIWYDEFSETVFTDWQCKKKEWSDADDIRMCVYVQRKLGISRMSVSTINDAVNHSARRTSRNGPLEYIKSIAWDGESRLVDLCTKGFGTKNSVYYSAVGKSWLLSVVARVLWAGCKVDTVPVFEGPQGTFKSSALKVLGGEWFVECHESILNKDFYEVLRGNMIVEIAEMHAFSRAEIERIKGIITCQQDRYRAAYGRNTVTHPRRSVLAGTTNRSDWNRDETGARRFWPVKCGKIDLKWIADNRDQLYAEAMERLLNGDNWHKHVPQKDAKAEQEKRRLSDTWEECVAEWLLTDQGMDPFAPLTSARILEECIKLPISKQDRPQQNRIASTMRLLGYRTKTARWAGKTVRVWVNDSDDDDDE